MFESSVFLVPVDKICHYDRYAPGYRVCAGDLQRNSNYTVYYNRIANWLQGRCCYYSYYFMYLSAALL